MDRKRQGDRTGLGAKTTLGAAALIVAGLGVGFFSQVAQTQEGAPTPTADIAPVDWRSANSDALAKGIDGARPEKSKTMVGAVGGEARAAQLKVPFLLPTSLVEAGRLDPGASGALDQPLKLVAGEYNYSAEAKSAPRSYLVQGTRYVFIVEELDNTLPPAAGPVSVERLEYGIEASFERYGVIYSVTIFCAAPETDEQCSEEETVLRLAAEMELVP